MATIIKLEVNRHYQLVDATTFGTREEASFLIKMLNKCTGWTVRVNNHRTSIINLSSKKFVNEKYEFPSSMIILQVNDSD